MADDDFDPEQDQSTPPAYMLAANNDDHYLIQGADGSTFPVAKDGLSDDTHVKITSLPPVPTASSASGDEEEETPEAPASSPETPAAPAAPANPLLAGAQNPMGFMAQAYGQQAAGIQGQAKAQEQMADAQSKALEQYQAQIEAQAKFHQQNIDKLNQEQEQLFQQVQNGKVDPDRYWSNLTTGGKVAASIGVILGGIGAGLTHGPNQALQVLQNAIERDIESQKADLGKKQNLYSMNMQRYQNENQADAATRLQMNTMLQAKVQQAAARAGSPFAQAQAQMLLGQLKQQQIPLIQSFAKMQTDAQLYGSGSGKGSGGLPVGQEPTYLLQDEKYRKNRIVVGNRAYQAASDKDAEDLRNLQAEYEPVRNLVNHLSSLPPSSILPGGDNHDVAVAIRARLVPMLNKMHGLNRLSEEDVKLMQDQIGDPTSIRKFITNGTVNDQFIKNLNEDMESNYKTRLVGYRGLDSLKSRKQGWDGQ